MDACGEQYPDFLNLSASWRYHLRTEFEADYMLALTRFLTDQLQQKKCIYPAPSAWLDALKMVSFENVRVVILGQDPYHGPGQAHGLSFSVREGIAIPPSLMNIYKEMHTDIGVQPAKTGSLMPWAQQGVLLLNSVLTVESGHPGSHQGKGWEIFTDRIIHELSCERKGLVFVLWGAYAQKKGRLIDRDCHLVITSVHPSPLSAHRGFFGSRPFSRINTWLAGRGEKPIDWRL